MQVYWWNSILQTSSGGNAGHIDVACRQCAYLGDLDTR